jgi:hypothetical protein
VQLLFSTGKSFTVEKLREFLRHEVAVAALSNVELILSCNGQLALVGPQLRIINGVVSLLPANRCVQNFSIR